MKLRLAFLFLFQNTAAFTSKSIYRTKYTILNSVNNPAGLIKKLGSQGIINNYGTPWSYSEFIQNIANKKVDSSTIITNQDKAIGIYSIDVDHLPDDINAENIHITKIIPDLLNSAIDSLNNGHINYDFLDATQYNLLDGIPFIFQIGFMYLLLSIIINFVFRRQSGGMGPGQNNFMNPMQMLMNQNDNKIDTNTVNVTFADVAGCEEAKYELMEVVDFLKNPLKFTVAGAKIPKGILLEGPPGTGKTLLARAVAGEAGVAFFQASGSQFIEMFVGVGASRVRELFNNAAKNEPCVIFIDEIDAIGRQRGTGLAGGNDEREQTLNQILTNMDGFTKSSGIIVLAATNRADILDSALTRPGRFDRKVMVGLPDKEGRREIIDVHFKDKSVKETQYLDTLATLTGGFSGADIANLANEAAILSVRYNETSITNDNIYQAFEKVTIGLPQKTENRPQDIVNMVAYHEVGHTLMALLFKDMFDVRKVTIQSNKNGAGGYTLFTPKEKYSNFPTKRFMLANMIIALGGRAAEVVYYGNLESDEKNYQENILFPKFNDLDVTTGASNDLKQANSIARQYVSLFGLGEQIGLYDSSDGSQPFLGREIASGGNKLSDFTKKEIDEEIKHLVQFAYESAIKIIKRNSFDLERMSLLLIEKKTLNENDLEKFNIIY